MEEPPAYPPLPKEILEQVFHHLSAFQLTRARLVCRAWNETICGSKTLLDRFVLLFNHVGTCRKNCPDCLALVNTRGRFHNFKSSFLVFDNLSLVGDHLQSLTLNCCYGLKMDYMINMLRHVSNLHSFTLSSVVMDDSQLQNLKLDIKLKHLTELSIINGQIPVKFLYVLKKICVSLEVLNIIDCFRWNSYSNHSDEQLFNLIFAVRDTLEQLGLTYRNIHGDLLEKIASIDRLELKKLSLQKCDKLREQHLTSLSRLQPGLQHLEVKSVRFSGDQVLNGVCQNLANVTCIKLETDQMSNTSWLNYMPYLVHLGLHSHGSDLNLDEAKLPNLKILFLEWVMFPPGNLQKLLQKVPNLHTLSLTACDLQNVPELLASLPQLNYLQHLKLKHIHNFVERFPPMFPHQTTNLRRLELINVVSSFPLQALCQRSPSLESVRLKRLNIGDRQLQMSCRALKHLKELNLQELTKVTGSFVEFICTNRRALEKITVSQCRQIRYSEKNRLNTLRGKIDVTF